MAEYPNDDEIFDFMYQDDFEILKELDDGTKTTDSEVTASQFQLKRSTVENSYDHEEEQPSTSNSLNIQAGQAHVGNICDNQQKVSTSRVNAKQKPRIISETILSTRNPYFQSINKKRTCDESFGDFSHDYLDMEPRKKRLHWDEPTKVIRKILDARCKSHLQDVEYTTSKKYESNEDRKDSISVRVPAWNFIAVTRSYDAQRLYVRVKTDKTKMSEGTKRLSNLLPVSYRQLKAEAQEIMVQNVQRTNILPETQNTKTKNTKKMEDVLWVDKYKPKLYVELLSDEAVNRDFLHWLKLWDKVVFGRDIAQLKKRKHRPKVPLENERSVDDDNEKEVDDKGYPIHRIVLLSGPPGLGKTTLARLGAQHAGYNVVEVNASDDRSPDAFRQILLTSTRMKAVMGADRRPNCLVLDEIDGAPVASIDVLLKYAQGKLQFKTKKKAKEERETGRCQRPVVCTCNELYASSLRALRAAALVIPVPEVSPQRLADRLVEIAQKERIEINHDDAVRLAERSGCDIRSCLGALQYMACDDLQDDASVGLKDTKKGLFDSWKEIFVIPMTGRGPLSLSERVQRIFRITQSGETDKLAEGVFHNYPEICKEKLENVSLSLDWFEFFDDISSTVYRQQSWSVMPYANYAFIAWHIHFSRLKESKITFPSVLNELNRKMSESRAIVAATRRASGLDVSSLIMDYAPFMPDLLTPQLRTVSTHLLTPIEEEDLARLVNAMLELGLTFIQEKNPEGGYEYKLDPNIFEIGIFTGCKAHRSLAYTVKQIVAYELERERLRRLSKATGMPNNEQNCIRGNSALDKERQCEQREKPKTASPVSVKTYKDFFGKITEIECNERNILHRIKWIFAKQAVSYKYKEGFVSAVRRDVSMERFV